MFQNEQAAKGKKLYTHYCMHCHGENGKQNEGFNWSSMPDPKPKDLSNKEEMGTFKDEEIFNTISRDMKDTGAEVATRSETTNLRCPPCRRSNIRSRKMKFGRSSAMCGRYTVRSWSSTSRDERKTLQSGGASS